MDKIIAAVCGVIEPSFESNNDNTISINSGRDVYSIGIVVCGLV